ncbi:hypothetical protein F0U60_53680 [Archangium minus]|uniref:Lipoprotein n=1 Tax=Archangium minus TaxID=83450 RepID=A0ABY9X9A6_9BACT|nr:hypothetical protein F0U60_53680 [Archangium minus]
MTPHLRWNPLAALAAALLLAACGGQPSQPPGAPGTAPQGLDAASTGLAYYPLLTPFDLLDTQDTRFPVAAYYAPGTFLRGVLTYPVRAIGAVPAAARAVVARVALTEYSGEWADCYWYWNDSSAQEEFVCPWTYNDVGNEPGSPSRYPVVKFSAAGVPGYIRLGSGPARPTSQVVILPLSADGTLTVETQSGVNVHVELLGYLAAPSPGGLYLHLLSRPRNLFATLQSSPSTAQGFSRLLRPGESLRLPVQGTWTTDVRDANGLVRKEPFTVPQNARVVIGSLEAFVVPPNSTWHLPLRNAVYADGEVVPEEGTTLWDEQVERGPFWSNVNEDGSVRLWSSTDTSVSLDVTGYFSATAADDGNGPGLLFTLAPQATAAVATNTGNWDRRALLTPPAGLPRAPRAVSGRLHYRSVNLSHGNGALRLRIAAEDVTPAYTRAHDLVGSAEDSLDETTFVSRLGAGNALNFLIQMNIDNPPATDHLEVDVFGWWTAAQ